MATAAFIPVSEYLSSSYEVDCDYVDGELQERNVGERPHSTLQGILLMAFNTQRKAWRIVALPEQRVQLTPTRYRIPDVCVLRRSDPVDDVVHTAPLVCIEILSPEDRMNRVLERLRDFHHAGVEHVWLFNPLTREAWMTFADGSQQRVVDAFEIEATPIRLDLAEVWAEFDDMRSQS